MSNPPRPGPATPDPRQRLPTTNMVLRSQPANISLTARRAQQAGPPPTQPTTTPTQPLNAKITAPGLTNNTPYQLHTRGDAAAEQQLERGEVAGDQNTGEDRNTSTGVLPATRRM